MHCHVELDGVLVTPEESGNVPVLDLAEGDRSMIQLRTAVIGGPYPAPVRLPVPVRICSLTSIS